ncbi:hypothetical protein N2W52_001975 [Clostridium perfringens]|nr:hypothetical protein [Clostridium perfringens]
MRDNIDLTENRYFRNIVTIKAKINKVPWNFKSFSSVKMEGINTLIGLGNKHDRRNQKLYREFLNNNSCERCGKKIKIPWDNCYGICKKCDNEIRKELSKQYSRIPWRKVKVI